MIAMRPVLNHAGSAKENPIISGIKLRVRCYKHNAAETLKRCWIRYAEALYKDLTASCAVTATTITVDITAGTDTPTGATPVMSEIYFHTSEQYCKAQFWVSNAPTHVILLDGYDASDQAKPLIWVRYRSV